MHSQFNTAQQAEVEVLIPSIWLLGETEALNQISCVQQEASVGGQLSLGFFVVFGFGFFNANATSSSPLCPTRQEIASRCSNLSR